MKKLSIIVSVFAGIIFLSGCKKEAEKIADFSFTPSSQALLKVNFVSNYAANPGVQISINKIRVSNLISARTPFPGGGFNTGGGSNPGYLEVTPGSVELSVAIPKKNTNTDSVTLFDKTITLEAGKYYTAHITDTGTNAKVVVLTDDLSAPEYAKAKYRFVNLMPNVAAVDLYYGTTLVASNVPYLQSSNYFSILVAGTTAQAWNVRESGTGPTGTVLATYTSSNTIITNRIYTAFALGYKGATDAARKPYVSFLYNK
jgi:hypothetical protein